MQRTGSMVSKRCEDSDEQKPALALWSLLQGPDEQKPAQALCSLLPTLCTPCEPPANAAGLRQARGRWREGQEQGAVARTAATRLLAELAGRPELHALLAESGAARARAAQGAALVRARAGPRFPPVQPHAARTRGSCGCCGMTARPLQRRLACTSCCRPGRSLVTPWTLRGGLMLGALPFRVDRMYCVRVNNDRAGGPRAGGRRRPRARPWHVHACHGHVSGESQAMAAAGAQSTAAGWRAWSLKQWLPQAAESAAADKTYGSLEQVPGTVAERQSVDEERFSSAALYGLAASPAGAAALLGERGAAVEGARSGGGAGRGL